METDKSPDLVPSAPEAERKAILSQGTKSGSVADAEQVELQQALEEMAEIIENEGGILTP
jgi:hypothetical protein